MVENIVKQETVMEYLVKFVKAVIQTEKNQLKPKWLENESFRNWKCNCRCYL